MIFRIPEKEVKSKEINGDCESDSSVSKKSDCKNNTSTKHSKGLKSNESCQQLSITQDQITEGGEQIQQSESKFFRPRVVESSTSREAIISFDSVLDFDFDELSIDLNAGVKLNKTNKITQELSEKDYPEKLDQFSEKSLQNIVDSINSSQTNRRERTNQRICISNILLVDLSLVSSKVCFDLKVFDKFN